MINNRFISFILLLIVLKTLCLLDNNHIICQNLISNQIAHPKQLNTIKINKNVTIENYFEYLDSIIKKYDSLTEYKLTEHLLVRANPWIIDTLKNTDYYKMMAKDSFVYNQRKMIVLPKGNNINIPNSIQVQKLLTSFQNTTIDINIPEYKLRIYEGQRKLYEFLVRVGRNEQKYLQMSDKIEDLRTKTGNGHIIGYNYNPRYVNPVDNHEYFVTKRDDGRVTKLPKIPFIEFELNGLRHGQLLHPTTNQATLGKAYSNGCIGTSESDAWIVFYYAPIGTSIKIRYDLKILSEKGDTIYLNDIYKNPN